MTSQTKPEAGAQNAAEHATQEELKTAKDEAAKAERDRVFGILNCDSAKLRPNAARVLAENPAMSVEAAGEILAGLPEESPGQEGDDGEGEGEGEETADNKNHFKEHMDNDDHPEAGAGEGDGEGGEKMDGFALFDKTHGRKSASA